MAGHGPVVSFYTYKKKEEKDVKERSDAGGFFYFPFFFSLRKKGSLEHGALDTILDSRK